MNTKLLLPVALLGFALTSCGGSPNSSSASLVPSVTSSVSSSLSSETTSESAAPVTTSESSSNQTPISTSLAPEGAIHAITYDDIPTTSQSTYLSDTEITVGEDKYQLDCIQQGHGSYANLIQAKAGVATIYNKTPMLGKLTIVTLDKSAVNGGGHGVPTIYVGDAANPQTDKATVDHESITVSGVAYDSYSTVLTASYFTYVNAGAYAAYISVFKIVS
jgi:hypothetical protein